MEQCFLYPACNHIDCNKPFCVRKYKLDTMYSLSFLSIKQKNRVILRVDDDKTDLAEFQQLAAIEKNILDFVKAGNNLYIHSSIAGNGKTSWAVRMIQAYFNEIWPNADESECHALFIDVNTFLSEYKNNITTKSDYVKFVIENINKAELVVWDDVATKQASDYDIDKLLTAINARLNAGKANIFTSNLNPAEVTACLGERLASRICHGSINIEFHGKGKRSLGVEATK